MEKHIAVPLYFLEVLKEHLGKDSGFSRNYCLDYLIDHGTKVPVESLPHHSKGELMEDAGLKDVSGIDCALPQGLVDNIQEKLNFNIVPHFVMDCRGNFKLLPITSIGRAIFPVIEKIIFNK